MCRDGERFHYSATASFDWSVCLHRRKIFIDATIKLTLLFKAAIPGDLDTPTNLPPLCHVNERTTRSQFKICFQSVAQQHEAERSLSTVQSVIVHLLNMCLILSSWTRA